MSTASEKVDEKPPANSTRVPAVAAAILPRGSESGAVDHRRVALSVGARVGAWGVSCYRARAGARPKGVALVAPHARPSSYRGSIQRLANLRSPLPHALGSFRLPPLGTATRGSGLDGQGAGPAHTRKHGHLRQAWPSMALSDRVGVRDPALGWSTAALPLAQAV